MSQFVVHQTLTSESGTTVRQLNVSHFQVTPDGTLHTFDKVVVTGG